MANLGIMHCARSKANPSPDHQWRYFADLEMHAETPRRDLMVT